MCTSNAVRKVRVAVWGVCPSQAPQWASLLGVEAVLRLHRGLREQPSALALLAPLLRFQAHQATASRRTGSQEGRRLGMGQEHCVSGKGDCLVSVTTVLGGGIHLE